MKLNFCKLLGVVDCGSMQEFLWNILNFEGCFEWLNWVVRSHWMVYFLLTKVYFGVWEMVVYLWNEYWLWRFRIDIFDNNFVVFVLVMDLILVIGYDADCATN